MAAAAQRILLLGGGNMGAALLGGWLDKGLDPARVLVVDPKVGDTLRPLIERYGVRHAISVPQETFDVALLAVKPQMMGAALPDLRDALISDSLVISIAAGTTIASIEGLLGEHPVVRAMPNTPALIGRGVTGAFANERVDAAGRKTADELLSANGPVEWVDTEPLIDAVTGVSGSGPAYVFHMAECLAKAGEAAGLPADLAMRLARHTVAGAGELMIRSDQTPAKLRQNVTSPNGTTQAALDVLMAEDGLAPLIERAVRAARDRAEALSKE
ncbi:pyrroline-5-carboxylate reductase [Aurantimonas manganoxydans SI85-9A1]|uniref:Pyrroline-5-carboxylate reductase n=1 Tax=Aurantimonas manganoxydans (strain ATCC BAA-1229 / DSM 21871 / SI85-9A1) TaxID=287752 RepID=Q1YLY4_AURMS|nr:pyrroline-5-carboxylate reductase [Aurantimonas manganoxydans]EAS51597.1 pyrroline-5-carboxylate reductase [Aurantimonas manganoxydans SI85-9A1]